MANRLAHPPSLSSVHPMFHVSMLKRYVSKVLYKGLDVKPDVSYEEERVWILDCLSMTLHRREVPLVKVVWSKKGVEEAIWEPDDNMQVRFP